MTEHEPRYYAVYKGPDSYVAVGEGDVRRAYYRHQSIEIGQEDADRIYELLKEEDNEHRFNLDQVPMDIIGTAEENQPTDPAEAYALNKRLLERDET